MVRRYIDSILIGLGIASFCILLNAIAYLGLKTIIIGLLQGVLQGFIVPLIYQNPLRIPYLAKVMIHALVSYLLVLAMFLMIWGLDMSMFISVTVSWLFVFGLVFVYFYQRNHQQAREINEKLMKRVKE